MSRKSTKLVISDTHIGAGGREQGNNLEDFISDADFVRWIQTLVKESNRDDIDMELIINGDWIEFLQIPAVDKFEPFHLYESDDYTSYSETEALQRLEIVQGWHPGLFLGLSDFLSQGPPRRTVTILFGNHDPEVVYPSVQTRLRQLMNATGEDADLVSIGERRYFKDGVFAEHGNAYVEEVNQFTDPDNPLDPFNSKQIERPAGSQFVTHFFNQLEWELPWIDGVHPTTSLLYYALAFQPALALDILSAFLRIAPDYALSLAKTPEPGSEGEISAQVLSGIDTPEEQAAVAELINTDPAYAAQFMQEMEDALIEQGAIPASPRDVAGSPSEPLSPQERARDITERYWLMLEDAAERIATEKGAQVILFGHIHEPIEKKLPSGAMYLNTGTWIWKGDFTEATDETWRDLINHPDKYMYRRDLSYARIDLDKNGQIISARLERAGQAPDPIPEPDPQPEPSFWAKLLLGIRHFFKSLFNR